MKLPRFLLLSLFVAGATRAADEDPPAFFRNPTVSRTHIVFEYGSDLWSVSRQGGQAVRLTAGPGEETAPAFSPDGSMVAFTGRYDGNVDVFVVPAAGGVPKRLTWHPGNDVTQGWTPDGKRVLFSSGRTAAPARYQELFTIGIEGGQEERLPLPIAHEGAYSADGKQLAYVPTRRAFTAWKRYRGGTTTPVWIADLATSKIEKVPRENSNDFSPMWAQGKVWFLSDREGPVTLFSYDPRTKKVARAVENKGMDFKSAAATDDAIVVEQFGRLMMYDLKSGKLAPVKVSVAGDLPEVRARFVKVGTKLRNPSISPNGARAVFEARGEILTVPEEKGDPRNLTNSPGVMERDPSWSPDGKSIAFFSDAAGEYALHIVPQDAQSDPKKISLGEKPSLYRSPRWSPDSKKIAYLDVHLALWYVDLAAATPVKVAKDRYYGGIDDMIPAWSPDSKWLAYVTRLPNHLGAIQVYSIADAKSTQVTDGMSDARDPAWDKGGKYLYFTASTDSGSSLQPDIHAASRSRTGSIYLVVLNKNDPSPLAPESDEEKSPDEKKPDEKTPEPAKDEEKKPEATKAPPKEKKPPEVKIDFENILQRVLVLPMPARRYVALQTGKTGVLLALESPQSAPGTPGPGQIVHRFDLKQRRADAPLSGVRFFQMAENGEKMLFSQGQGDSLKWLIGTLKPLPPSDAPPPAAPAGGSGGAKTLKTTELEVRIDPREEWPQMYREVWRIQREMFYDPGLHGLELTGGMKRYERYVAHLSSRTDLNYLFQDMMGELSVGHLNAGGGEQPEVKTVSTGLLGADFEVADGKYRFKRIYNGENWNPTAQAPLTQPGVNVRVGEYLLAVDGSPVATTDSVYRFFEGKSGKQVTLRVGGSPDGEGARNVVVVPVASDSSLRTLAWVEENRRKVDQATNGRVAYIYLPDTSTGGYTNFNRYFFAQIDKQAAIVDERFNAGGMLATDVVEMLMRKPLSRVATRDGEDERQPQGAIEGPKVMLINEYAGSGGDAMPWYFRRAGVGPLIGTRTWGGLVGRAGSPPLMDGGFVSSPSSAVWDPSSSKWIAENVGVEPDIEVELDPAAARQGRDPILDKAVQVVMAELAKRPMTEPKRPAFPNYYVPGGPPTPNTANAVRR